MKMKKIMLMASAMVTWFMMTPAHAGILIEPFVGYHIGKIDEGGSDVDLKGLTFGGRLGYQMLGLMAGLEYETGDWTADTTPEIDVTPKNLGVFIGYNFPVLFRIYGTYAFKSKLDADPGAYEGTQFKIGVGFKFIPMMSINAEYFMGTYDEFAGNKLAKDVETKGFGVTISVPLNI